LRHERHAVLQRNREEQVHVRGPYELNHGCTGVRESGIGWLPYALDRMDFEYEDRFRDWRRQCKATFQFDPIGTKLVDDIGVETLMWGSDYPHTDGVWPESSKYIKEQFAGLAPEVVHKIPCENAGKFYGLIN
jgi:uncharacterized protein